MITIGHLKKSQNAGFSKKTLHIPTMCLFTVKEEPIREQELA